MNETHLLFRPFDVVAEPFHRGCPENAAALPALSAGGVADGSRGLRSRHRPQPRHRRFLLLLHCRGGPARRASW